MSQSNAGAVASTDQLEPGACICRMWCRSDLGGVMTDGRRYPGPEHADGCPAQVRERFVRVRWGGAECVIEPHERPSWLEDECADEYTFTDVMLTRDQFERMHEFQGF